MILGAELLHQHVAAEQADFADAPVAAPVIKYPIRRQRLVRPVKGAKAEVDNARPQPAAIVAGQFNEIR